MIRDAPVLLLDEPTTGLDAAATRRILVPMRRLMAGRSTVIISHNLLAVTDADQLVVSGEQWHVSAAGTPGAAGRATRPRAPVPCAGSLPCPATAWAR